MKQIKRVLCLVFALCIVVSQFTTSVFAASYHTTTPTGYTSASDVKYVKVGSYIANWGARGEVATFLSTYAKDFYSGSCSQSALFSMSGGTSQSSAPSSELYRELKNYLTDKQSRETKYDDNKNLMKYTDCVSGDYSKISAFYSGKIVGSSWVSGGKTWNREHTWPNSKGDASGNGENDIMMLRPEDPSNNTSRGNKAYGKSSSFYNPNSESNGNHDLRGDVARIFLYVYVRWGDDNRNNAWGSSGVMESSDVLLEWMEADPVDTWELGRNDSVEAITGTRNVFVDYPELAFLLFGEEVPSDMVTPSGEAKKGTPSSDCDHTYTNDCDSECNLCGYIRVAIHVYSNDCDTECNACGNVRVARAHIYSYACDTTCNSCGAERIASHRSTGWQTVKEPTESEAGLEKGTCVYCKAETEREIPKLTPPTDDPTKPADPTNPDDPTDKPVIPNCSEGIHAYSDWEMNKNGVNERYCTECGIVETESQNDDECKHTFTDWEKNSDGKNERYCTECGLVETEKSGENNTAEAPETPGFFERILNFFKSIFENILSIFKKNK